MTLHIYRSRQVHKTLNGVNPSSSFRDMRSAKSGPNLWQIWQVFGPWASPYGANGQITKTVHNYRPRQFHRTSNGENPSSGYRDMRNWQLPPARPPEPWRQYPSSPKGWGVKTDLEDPRSRSCVRSKFKSQCESNILSTHIPLVLCQSALPFLRYSIFKIWLENPSEWVSD